MNEDFAPFELAVKLKEKGFREKCIKHYYPNSKDWFISSVPECDNFSSYIDAPTISQVLKWLREEKKIHLMIDIWKVDINDTTYKWGYDIVNLTTTHVEGCDIYCANSYEQAALAGIEYVLDNLI